MADRVSESRRDDDRHVTPMLPGSVIAPERSRAQRIALVDRVVESAMPARQRRQLCGQRRALESSAQPLFAFACRCGGHRPVGMDPELERRFA